MKVNIIKGIDKITLTFTDEPCGVSCEDVLRHVADGLGQGISAVTLDMAALTVFEPFVRDGLVAISEVCSGKNVTVLLQNVSENVYKELGYLSGVEVTLDLSTFSAESLVELFKNADYADTVSDFMVLNYSDYQPILAQCAVSEDPIVREYGIITIGKAHDSAMLPVIRKGLESEYPTVVKVSLRALGWMWDTESEEQFYKFILSDDFEISEAAGASLALISDEGGLERLAELGKSDKPHIRSIVAGVLSIVNGDKAFSIMEGMLHAEENLAVKSSIVKYLSYFNREEATKILISLIDDPDRSIQESAVAGLERTGLRGYEDVVLKKINSSDTQISYLAVKALGAHFSANAANYLMAYYYNAQEIIKLAILGIFGSAAGNHDGFADFFMAQMNDPNEDIRQESLAALYKADVKRAIDMAKILVKDSSWIVRYEAVGIIGAGKPIGYAALLNEVREADDNKYIREKISSILGVSDAK